MSEIILFVMLLPANVFFQNILSFILDGICMCGKDIESTNHFLLQKQLFSGALRISSSEIMQQIYRRIKLLCNFIEIALRHGCSHVNLLHIFRTPFPKNTSGRLLLLLQCCLFLQKDRYPQE